MVVSDTDEELATALQNPTSSGAVSAIDMSDSLTLSPAALGLLEIIERQSGLSLDVVHVWLDPVRRSGASIGSLLHETEVAGEILKALRTGEVRVGVFAAGTLGLFPLRRVRDIVGCLVVSRPGADVLDEAANRLAIESTGALARGLLESDLNLSGQLAASLAATRRTHATLRFLGQLGTYDSDRDVLHAVLHAANIWFDLDCRIYERRSDGRYVLSGALPREERSDAIDGARAAQLVAVRRLSPADLDDLGLEGHGGDVLVLPVGGREPNWLMVLTGALDTQVELTFEAIARVMTGDLQARELARVDRWQRRLTHSPQATQSPEAALTELLEELVADAGAEGGLVRVLEGSGAGRVAAAVGSNALGTFRSATDPVAWDPNLLELRVAVAPDVSLQVVLSAGRPLSVSAGPMLQAWVKALRPWMAEVVVGGARQARTADHEGTGFERRIQQEIDRARRFDLSLCLLLVGADQPPASSSWVVHEPLAAAVKSELRASDLCGTLHNGALAVVLVHAGEEGARSVIERVKARVERVTPHLSGTMQVGRAVFTPDCASAADLIANAKRAVRAFRSMH